MVFASAAQQSSLYGARLLSSSLSFSSVSSGSLSSASASASSSRSLLHQTMPAAEEGALEDLQRILECSERLCSSLSLSSSILMAGPYAVMSHPSTLATTACIIACTRGHTALVRYLLQHRLHQVQINVRDEDGDAALDCAAAAGYADIVELLLQHPNIRINAVAKCGRAALHYAAQHGNVAMVRVLLRDPRTNVNLRTHNDDGMTALHWASHNGHVPVIRVLLGHAATDWRATTTDQLRQTAWDFAKDKATRDCLDRFRLERSVEEVCRGLSLPQQPQRPQQQQQKQGQHGHEPQLRKYHEGLMVFLNRLETESKFQC